MQINFTLKSHFAHQIVEDPKDLLHTLLASILGTGTLMHVDRSGYCLNLFGVWVSNVCQRYQYTYSSA